MNHIQGGVCIPEKKLIRPISLMGLPGCGKSTQGRLLAQETGAFHVDQGNSRRSIIEGNHNIQEAIGMAKKSHYKKLKQDIGFRKEYVHMILEWNGVSGIPPNIILNGFVRDEIGRQSIEEIFGEFIMIYFMISRETSHQRVKSRGERPKDKISKARSGRMRAFAKNTLPVLKTLQGEGRCINVNAEKTIKEIQGRLQDRLVHEGALEGHIPLSKKPKKKVKKKEVQIGYIERLIGKRLSELKLLISGFFKKKPLYRNN